jgi:hypothetical protein
MTTFTTEDRIIAEKDGSFTVNVNGGEISMSTRSHGMVGKTYSSASDAFRDADYATAIERPYQTDFSGIGAFLAALAFLAVFAYGFWLTIGRF